MFKQAANLDSGEKEEDRHHVHDLDILLNYADDHDDEAPLTEATRQQQIEDMRRMAAMVNDAMGGGADG